MAIDSMVKRLLDERDQKLSLIDNIASVADENGRDLLESESTTISDAQARVRSLNDQIDRLSQDLELADSAKNRIRSLDPTIVASDFKYRTAGEYVWDLIHRNEDSDANIRLGKFHKRAAEHMGFDKENTVPVAGGFNGLVVVPNLGPVLDPTPSGRPLFTAMGVRPAPSLSFYRPRLVDPDWQDGVGVVAQEKAEMPSRAWDILNETVTCSRVGGYINVSEVLVELLAGSLDMVVNQMNRRLEKASELAVVNELAKTGATVTVTGDDLVAAIGEATTIVIQNTGMPPTWMAMGPAGYGSAIGLTDAAGRPLIPPIGPVNAIGAFGTIGSTNSIMGLTTAVTPAITDKTFYIGNSFGLEIYERPLPLMQAFEPSLYGRQVAVATYLGFYAPITTEAVTGGTPAPEERNGVVKGTWA